MQEIKIVGNQRKQEIKKSRKSEEKKVGNHEKGGNPEKVESQQV